MTSTDQPTPVLSIQNLSLRRGVKTILKDINWTINGEEHWAILGANGCGKTSLLSALTGYLSPSAGTIQCMGDDYGAADWN